MIETGDVFLWRNFPFNRDKNSEIKSRLFVCVGKSDPFMKPRYLYVVTSTTRLHYYARGGLRRHHSYMKISASEECGFVKDSIVDVDCNFYTDVSEHCVSEYVSNIEILCKMPERKLTQLSELIQNSKEIVKKVKDDVKRSISLLK